MVEVCHSGQAATSADEKLDLILRRLDDFHLQKQQLDVLLSSLKPLVALLSSPQLTSAVAEKSAASAFLHSNVAFGGAPFRDGRRDSGGSDEHSIIFARSEDLDDCPGHIASESYRAANQRPHVKHSVSNSRPVNHTPSLDVDKWTRQLKDMQMHSESGGSVRKYSATPNIKEMDSAFLAAVEAPVLSSLQNSDQDSGKYSSADELPPQGVVPNGRVSRRHVVPEPSALPGKLHEAPEEDDDDDYVPPRRDATAASARLGINMPPAPSASIPVGDLARMSQNGILDKLVTAEDVAAHDIGCRVAAAFPRALYFTLILLPIPAFIGTEIAIRHFSPGVDSVHPKTIGYNFYLGAIVVHCCAAALGMHLLRTSLCSGELRVAIDKLHAFVENSKVWSDVSRRLRRQLFVAWIFSVIIFVVTLEEWKLRTGVIQPSPLSEISTAFRILGQLIFTICFIVASAVIFLVAYVQAHFLHGMDLSLDSWCCSLLHERNFHFGVESWNCMQALLKCIGRELSSSFLALQVFGAMGLVYCLVSVTALAFETQFTLPATELLILDGLAALPLLCFFAVNVRVCSKGAALTEKCRAIPAFVNQIPTDSCLDDERQYLVHFVLDSAAGFNVKHFTITQEVFIKNFIMIGGLLSGLVAVLSRIY